VGGIAGIPVRACFELMAFLLTADMLPTASADVDRLLSTGAIAEKREEEAKNDWRNLEETKLLVVA
jgi:hypothetical protein